MRFFGAQSLLFTMVVILLLISPNSAQATGAAAGVAPNYINEGSEASFSGTFYNLLPIDVYLLQMGLEFIQGSSYKAAGNAERFNQTKVYPTSRQKLAVNTSFTDIFTTQIDYEPGTYNVSIFFITGNTSDANVWNEYEYALVNQTIVILGVNNPLKFLLGFSITVVSAFVLVMAYVIIRRRWR